MGTVGSAFAIHAEIPAETQAVVAKGTTQITLGGELRFRGEFKHATDLNSTSTPTTGFDEAADDNDAKYDGRVRIRLQADVTKNTQGVIHLESAQGESNTSDSYDWGTDSEGKGIYPRGNGKRGDLKILEAWVLHKFNIGVPTGIKVGHMPLALGNKLFFDHTKFGDDAIVLFFDPTKELHIGFLTIKIAEGTSNVTDDANAHVGLFAYKGKGFNISGDVTYVDDQRANITTNGAASTTTMTVGDMGTHITNVGLRGDVTFGSFNIMADAELQSGKSDFENASDIKHKGRAFMLGASYKLAPVTIHAKYAYGSGDSDSGDNNNDVFVTAMGASQHYTYVYEYRVAGATGNTATGLANTTYVNVGAAGKLTKDLSASLDYYVLRATKSNSTGTIRGATTTVQTHDSKKIGSELDGKITYQLDRNLVYFVEGGYLWTGKFYDTTTVSAEDAYAVRHGITLSF